MIMDVMVSSLTDKHAASRICIRNFKIVDIDECNENMGGCEQLCSNTPGSYVCSCRAGYRLASDDQTCNGNCYSIIITNKHHL